MPRGYFNWTFRDVELFLRENGFGLVRTEGSHYHYLKMFDGKPHLVQVQYHGSNTAIKPRTMKSIIEQSGISKQQWFNW